MKTAYTSPASLSLRLSTEGMMALSRIDGSSEGGTTITDKEEFLSGDIQDGGAGTSSAIWDTTGD